MRIRFAATVSILALGLATTAFAQPQYSDDYSNDSDGFAPSKVETAKPLHYAHRTAVQYSDDYTNDSDGFAPAKVGTTPKVDRMATASIKPLPDCHSMIHGKQTVHTQGGDSGATRPTACRETH
jgi:hypothetical protein